MSSQRLKGQTAWINGGASGMGEATAELFAEEGANVGIADIQADRGKKLVDRIMAKGGKAIFTECDVTKESAIKASIDRTVKEFGGLQILVCCAGIVHVKLLHEYEEKDWDQLMNVNVRSTFFSLKHAHPHLIKNKRSYMSTIGSIGSFISQAKTPAYIMSKGAVLMLTKSIALDYAADGLRCNCICPGITDTPLLRFHLGKNSDEELAKRIRRVPTGVPIQPRDIAKAALYFSCEDSAGVTGASLLVDGGQLAAAEWECPPKTRFMEPV